MSTLYIVTDALDTLALRLTDHKHRWSVIDRRKYERAVALLKDVGRQLRQIAAFAEKAKDQDAADSLRNLANKLSPK
jgi:hypothetical protein